MSEHSPGQGCPAARPLWLHTPEGQRGEGRGPWCLSLAGHFIQGKRTLLPLRKAEKKTVIFPCDPSVQASEMRNVVSRPWGRPRGVGRGIGGAVRGGRRCQLRACGSSGR